MKYIDNIPVWGNPDQSSIDQMKTALEHPQAVHGALMADHHLGYGVPIGGVIAYDNAISPTSTGYDIACGNKAVQTDANYKNIGNINRLMDDVAQHISFGVGRKNNELVDDELFDDPLWKEFDWLDELKPLARSQLGTVGSGNHYVDIFIDEKETVWIGVHFGSRGLGHKITTKFINLAGAKQNQNVVLGLDTALGQDYFRCMNLAGRYAYAGRDWVCSKVNSLLGSVILTEVHNHHNFAWKETWNGKDLVVIRKGATPARPGQLGFVGGSMGEDSVILQGVSGHSDYEESLGSTVHGAGRVLSRNEAAGKYRWKSGQRVKIKDGIISKDMMHQWLQSKGVVLRGGGCDESPHCYKRLTDVLAAHETSIKIVRTLRPIGVAMAGENEYDPYKD